MGGFREVNAYAAGLCKTRVSGLCREQGGPIKVIRGVYCNDNGENDVDVVVVQSSMIIGTHNMVVAVLEGLFCGV